eukprot:SAG31_NODE_6093_length_2173_cov_1.546287_3_plen_72_part_00
MHLFYPIRAAPAVRYIAHDGLQKQPVRPHRPLVTLLGEPGALGLRRHHAVVVGASNSRWWHPHLAHGTMKF